MKLEREIERHNNIISWIDDAETIDELPNISMSSITSYISSNTYFGENKFNQKDFKSITKMIMENKSDSEIKNCYIKIITNKYPETSIDDINKKYTEIFEGVRIKYILEEINIKNGKAKLIKDSIDKENHEEVMKQINNAYEIKDLPNVGLGDLNKNILRNANNNSLKKRFKISELSNISNAYLNNKGMGIPDYIIRLAEKQDLNKEEKRLLYEEILKNLINDKIPGYIASEINAKEERKLFIYKYDHEETMENIKEAKRISQLPQNLSASTLTSYLVGNSTIYSNDNRLKSENLKNLTNLLLGGNTFDDDIVIEEIKNITNKLYPEKEDAYILLINKYKSLPKTNYLVEEINFSLEKQKVFIKNCSSNVNVYFIPNEKSPIDGGKFFNVYINRVDNLNLDDILPEDLSKISSPKMDIDSVEWYVQENFDPTFKLVGGIITNKDETIGNVNVFRPNDGKVGVSREEKEKINKIDDLDKEIEEKEKTSEYIEEQMNQIINEYEKKALELQKQMLEQMVTLRNSISSKKLTLKKNDNE